MRARLIFVLLLCALIATVAAGCFARDGTRVITPSPGFIPGGQPPPQPAQAETPTPFVPPTATFDASTAPTPNPPPAQPPTGSPIRLARGPNIPPKLLVALEPLIASGRYVWANESEAQVRLVSLPPGTTSPLTARWVYVPAMAFATVAGNITLADIQRYWYGDTAALAPLTENGQPPVFITTAPVLFWLTGILGSAAQNVPVELTPPDQIAQRLWERRAAWALVAFDELDPTLKALTLDGVNIFNRAVAIEQWPLVETFGFVGTDAAALAETINAVQAAGRWPATNRDPARLTALIMTGVTALTRATAYQMEIGGITTPARDILPFIAEGDLVHTSNEVSFAKNCPYPNPYSTDLIFCSRESYFDLLKTISLDIVELTGNHVNDWGTAALSNSLDMYDAHGVVYFGGGRNLEDAKKAAIVQHNGNTIAFLGCNPVGPRGAWADETKPGAAPCDDAFLSQEIGRLRALGHLVIMTLQYQEYYQYTTPPAQNQFFRKYAAMGANAVMGSQAHQPQGFAFTAFRDGAFIHFGIGNLFFDQMWSLGTRQMFADKLYVYENRILNVELFTGLIENYSRPRPMSDTERAAFLRTIFKASGY